jgi:hypothetical protein
VFCLRQLRQVAVRNTSCHMKVMTDITNISKLPVSHYNEKRIRYKIQRKVGPFFERANREAEGRQNCNK